MSTAAAKLDSQLSGLRTDLSALVDSTEDKADEQLTAVRTDAVEQIAAARTELVGEIDLGRAAGPAHTTRGYVHGSAIAGPS